MNRKQRRAALKQKLPGGAAADPAAQLFAEAVALQRQNKYADATRAYKRVLLIKPDHAEANNNLGIVLLAQGKASEASAHFARALTLMPQLFEQYQGICATLVAVLPPIGQAIRKTLAAWPKRLTREEMFGSAGVVAIAGDPLLRCLLQSVPVRELALERMLTSLRAALMSESATDSVIELGCALARQCFINEYVFATTPKEDVWVDELKSAIAAGGDVSPMQLVALAMYLPLYALPNTDALIGRRWPPAVADVLTQQIREPAQELVLRASIPRLTEIEDHVSRRVRQQYEENPYPRWVHVAGQVVPVSIDQYLRDMFPAAPLTLLDKTEELETLVAGCGTGWHAIELTQKFRGARVLAVDLSATSLAFAKRSTPVRLIDGIDYAQGDILKLGSLARTFDVIDASGVLHHMADPMQGWRILLALLRPGGLMHVGLYSELGRRDVVKARAFIAERGLGATPAEIRVARQELLEMPLRSLVRFSDFFTTSECRDLLFHVQEERVTIPAIKNFLAEENLRFLGFEFDADNLQRYRTAFAHEGWSMTDLDRWHVLETEYPDTFSGMYQLWVQKS